MLFDTLINVSKYQKHILVHLFFLLFWDNIFKYIHIVADQLVWVAYTRVLNYTHISLVWSYSDLPKEYLFCRRKHQIKKLQTRFYWVCSWEIRKSATSLTSGWLFTATTQHLTPFVNINICCFTISSMTTIIL